MRRILLFFAARAILIAFFGIIWLLQKFVVTLHPNISARRSVLTKGLDGVLQRREIHFFSTRNNKTNLPHNYGYNIHDQRRI